MPNSISKIKKICDIIFHITNLDIHLMDENYKDLLFLSHNHYSFPLMGYGQEYLDEMAARLDNKKESACYLHEIPSLSLIFFDIRVQESDSAIYYVCIGPVLSEVYSANFAANLITRMNLSASLREPLSDFYKQLPFYSPRIRDSFWASFHLITASFDPEDIPFTLEDYSIETAPHPSSYQYETERSISRESIRQNYESEIKWRAAVSRGDSKAALRAFSEMSSNNFTYRMPSNPLRVIKNTLLSVNALCRAAAIDGGASPIDVHHTHERFSMRIERANTIMDIEKIRTSLFDSYCSLVIRSHIRKYSPMVAKAVEYLYHYYEQPLTLGKVANAIHYSEGHLSRNFCKETGKTLREYLNQLRIEQSISLLQTGLYRVTDVALNVGFSSYTKFSAEFKKHTGTCASDYIAASSALRRESAHQNSTS